LKFPRADFVKILVSTSNAADFPIFVLGDIGITKFAVVDEGDDSKKSFKRLHRWRYSPTACYGNNEVHLHPYKVRRISVAEALAIQSLPANFVLPENMTLTNMFKTIGNGVPYLASKGLAQTILDFLATGDAGKESRTRSDTYGTQGERSQCFLPSKLDDCLFSQLKY